MDLSVILTGFDLIDLQATAMGPAYLDTLIRNAGPNPTGDLLGAYCELAGRYQKRGEAFHRAFSKEIMIPFGPLAQNVITLWYLGRWNQLPPSWRDDHLAFASDQTAIVSPDAYVQGLLWKAIDSHPRSAKAPGFGTWAQPPRVPESIPGHERK